MPTPTYVAIAKTVLTGTQTTVDFNSIPSTYTDLVLLVSARSASGGSASDNISLKINGSTTTYSYRFLSGNGSAALSGNGTPAEQFAGDMSGSGGTSNTFSNIEIYIPNYTGSTNKVQSITSAQENNTTAAFIRAIAGLWSTTSAVTSISLRYFGGGVDFASGSRFDLYGIKNS